MPTKTLTLTPGECVIFPKDVTILAVVPTGDMTVTSTCDDFLPAPTGYKCWQFKWEGDNIGGDYSDVYFMSITIGGVEYPFVDPGVTNSWDNGGDYLQSAIPISVPAGLCTINCNAGGTAVTPKRVSVSVPAYLGMPLLKYTNPSFEISYMIPYEDVCTC